jgi:hypothetical protein
MELIYGVGQVSRVVPDVEGLLRKYLDNVGLRYLGYQPSMPRDALVPEDLAVTILVNSRVGWRAFASVQEFARGSDREYRRLAGPGGLGRDEVAAKVASVADPDPRQPGDIRCLPES